ncbi:amino acid transporter [Lepidopterella palustris CBS 459.81]|uniref:Amino acid transporter n=1 Tax=Lepidopterella palustris CBS 459.81 TaxID=1314670 RepID=A0A8E2JGG3_9PEZI|nr:amino acid transporter [Lepidopterella palustris CBS 459.81]
MDDKGAKVTEISLERSRSDIDDQELTRLGKKPVLKRNFGFMSMLAFACTVMITWEGVLLLFSVSFNNGGYGGSVYEFMLVWAGTAASFTTMGELASMAPTAGGQYHWVSMLAPKSSRKILSYIVGWLTVTGWQAIVASGCYLCATLITSLMEMNDNNYTAKPWQAMLFYWAAVAFAISVNTVISQLLPNIESLILILHTVGFFGILIPLVYFAPHGKASDVFGLFLNEGEWQTQGLSFMVGTVGQAFNLLGADSAVHMSEEIHNPAMNVPRAMVFSILLNGGLGLGMLVAALFCLGDPANVLNTSSYGFAFMTIFKQAIGSLPGALTMAAIITILNICATISFVATASRMTWAFARDRGTPGWATLSKVESRTSLPLMSIGLTSIIAILLSLVGLGSYVAFNDVVSLSINGLYTSYLIGNTLLLYRRLTGGIKPYSPSDSMLRNTIDADHLVWGPWRIQEPLGTIINAFGVIYLTTILFFSFWPTGMNPTPELMNYSVVMVGAVAAFSVVYYLAWARRTYSGPVIEVDAGK